MSGQPDTSGTGLEGITVGLGDGEVPEDTEAVGQERDQDGDGLHDGDAGGGAVRGTGTADTGVRDAR